MHTERFVFQPPRHSFELILLPTAKTPVDFRPPAAASLDSFEETTPAPVIACIVHAGSSLVHWKLPSSASSSPSHHLLVPIPAKKPSVAHHEIFETLRARSGTFSGPFENIRRFPPPLVRGICGLSRTRPIKLTASAASSPSSSLVLTRAGGGQPPKKERRNNESWAFPSGWIDL